MWPIYHPICDCTSVHTSADQYTNIHTQYMTHTVQYAHFSVCVRVSVCMATSLPLRIAHINLLAVGKPVSYKGYKCSSFKCLRFCVVTKHQNRYMTETRPWDSLSSIGHKTHKGHLFPVYFCMCGCVCGKERLRELTLNCGNICFGPTFLWNLRDILIHLKYKSHINLQQNKNDCGYLNLRGTHFW